VEVCYAVTPDCAEVAQRFYGIPRAKLKQQSLGTDTDLFHPVTSDRDRGERAQLRRQLGFAEDDIVCIYTGRFTEEKNPLLLAKAIEVLAQRGASFKGLFIGNGVQASEIDRSARISVLPFMTHRDLARHYRAADIAVWPRQESISHLDAAATGLPVVLSNRVGEPARVVGNGKMYAEGSLDSLVDVLWELASADERQALGAAGRRKMVEGFSWKRFAESLETDFLAALGGAKRAV
jgi:glycosyltransferase involved in cell wall biosynthesis